MPKLPTVPIANPQAADVAIPPVRGGQAYDQVSNVLAEGHQQAAKDLHSARQTISQIGDVGEEQLAAMQSIGSAIAQVSARQTDLQNKEDWISGALAKQDFYAQADKLFNESVAGLTTKQSLDAFTQQLTDLHDKTMQGYTGSDAGRAKLMVQLGDSMLDYNSAALKARARNINDLTVSTLGATTNRLAGKAYEMPNMIGDYLQMSDAAIADVTSAMSPADAAVARQKMQSSIVYSAIDGRLNYGDATSAQELLASPYSRLLDPQSRSTLDRRLRETLFQDQQRALEASGRWSAGPGGVMTNSVTGEQALPSPDVQAYQMGLTQAGRANSTVTVQNQAEGQYAKDRASAFTKQLDTYAAQAQTSGADLQRTKQITQLLEGAPTGNLPSDIQYQVSRFLNVNQEQVANRQTADKLTGEMVLEIVRKLAPVTADDRRYAERITPGSAQTPAGRKKLLYLMERNNEFDQSMAAAAARADNAVAAGIMPPAQALQKLQQWEQMERKRMATTFNPPRFEE